MGATRWPGSGLGPKARRGITDLMSRVAEAEAQKAPGLSLVARLVSSVL